MPNQNISQYNLANLRNQQQVNFSQGLNPAMQGADGAEVMQQAGGGTYVNRVKASQDADPLTTAGLTLGIGYGIGQAMDHFGPRCEGKYEETVLGKLGIAGDRFAKNTKLGRFIENSFQKFDDYLTRKAKTSKIAYALKNHSTMPEWSFAKMPFFGLTGYWSMDAKNIIEQDLKPISAKQTKIFMFIPWKKVNDFMRLGDYGMSEDAIKAFEDSLKGKTFEQQALELQKKELELLGTEPAIYSGKTLEEMQEIAKEQKAIKRYKCTSLKELERRLENILENQDEFMDMLKNATKDDKVRITINKFDNSLWGRIKSHFIGRTVSLQEYYNKGLAAMGKGSRTRMGRFLPKALGWLTEGATNRYAGGKLAPFLQATILADMVYHAAKAPKGEHGKTFIERFVNDFTYFVGGTLGVIGIHKFGGFKYLGTDNAGREAYRAALKDHNILRKAGAFASKKEADAALKEVNKLLNTDKLNFFQKMLQKAALLVNAGNEHAVAYHSNAKYNLNFLRKIANTNLIGVPLRIWLVMGVLTPILVKLTTKTAHAIFGKPTNSVLDEGKEDEETQNTQNPSMQQPSSQDANPVTPQNNPTYNNPAQQTIQPVPQYKYNPQTGRFDEIPVGSPEYVDQTQTAGQMPVPNPQTPQNPQQPAANQTPYNPNNPQAGQQTTNNPNTTIEPTRTYIPSAAPVQTQGPDMTPADRAMANADKAEKEVQSILAGRA